MNRIINDDDKEPTIKEQLHLNKLINDLEGGGGSPSPPPDPFTVNKTNNNNNIQSSSISNLNNNSNSKPPIVIPASVKPPPVNPIVIPASAMNNTNNNSNTISPATPATPCTPLKTVDPSMICRLFQFQEEDLVATPPHPVSKVASSRPNNEGGENTPQSTASCPTKPSEYDIAARLLKFQHEDMEENNMNNSAPTIIKSDNNNEDNNNKDNDNIRRDLTVSATFKFTSRLNTVTISTPEPKKSVIINDAEEPDDNSLKRPLLITPFDPFFKPKSLLPISLANNNNNHNHNGNENNRKFVARSASGNFVLDDIAEAIDGTNNTTAFTIIPSSSSYVPKTSESGSRFETIDWNELDKRIEACPANISIVVHPNKSKRAVRPVKIAPENKENNAISNLLSTNPNSGTGAMMSGGGGGSSSIGHSMSSSHLHSYSQHNVLLRSSSALHNSNVSNNRRMLTKNATDSELSSTHSYHKSRESSLSDTSNINPNSNSQVTSAGSCSGKKDINANNNTPGTGTISGNGNGNGNPNAESTISGSNSTTTGGNNNTNALPPYLKAVSTSGNMTTYILDTSPDIITAPSSLSPQRFNNGNTISGIGGRINTYGSGTSMNGGRINSYNALQPFKLKKSLQSNIYSNDSPSLPLRIKKTWESLSPQLTPTNNFASLNKVKPYSSSKLKKECNNDSITLPKPSPVQAYSHFSFSTKNNKVAPDNSPPPPHP